MAITSGLTTPIRHPIAGNLFMEPDAAVLTAGMNPNTFFHGDDTRFSFTRASTATLLGLNGRIQSSAIDNFRFDYDPLNATAMLSGGWLCEAEATNLLPRSEELDDVAWTKTGATITADVETAPDGATTMDRIVEDASTGAHGVEDAIAFGAGARIAASCWADAINRDFLHIEVETVGGIQEAWFDLSTGTVGTVTGAVAAVISPRYRDGGFRCYLQADAAGGETAADVRFEAADADGSSSYTGTTQDSIMAWGFQAEQGNMTSYIPTAGATVTRAQDRPEILLLDLAPNHFDLWIDFDFLTIPSMDAQILTPLSTTTGPNGESFALAKTTTNIMTINISDNAAALRFTNFAFNVGDFAPRMLIVVEWDNALVDEDRVWMDENDVAMAFASTALGGTSTWTVMPTTLQLYDLTRATGTKIRGLVVGA